MIFPEILFLSLSLTNIHKQTHTNTLSLKDPCSEFSKVGILHIQLVEGHFWSPRSPKKKKFFKKFFFLGGVKSTFKTFFSRPVGLIVKLQNLKKNKYHPIILGLVSIGLKEKS